MSNQTDIVALIKSISGQANILTIPRLYLDLLNNNHRAALFLSQCVYWSDRSRDPDGWFWKSDAEWQDEIGLPRGGLNTAKKATRKYIDTRIRKVGGTPKSHYRVKLDVLVSDISDLLVSGKSDSLVSNESDSLENGDSSITKTTTSKTTSKIKRGATKKTVVAHPLVNSVEVQLVRDILKRYPAQETFEKVVEAVKSAKAKGLDEPKIRELYVEWLTVSSNKYSLVWLIEWAAQGGRSKNGKQPANNDRKPAANPEHDAHALALMGG